MPSPTLQRLAAVLAALAIVLGALGAHGPVHDALGARHTLPLWEKAVFYHLLHAIVLWVLARFGDSASKAWWFLLVGIVGFSGSLYALALATLPFLGPVTPVGGLFLLLGWGWLAGFPVGQDQGRKKG